eukprot:SAG11_NODE_12390_length_705_cov_33.232673_1_plen_186_part_00
MDSIDKIKQGKNTLYLNYCLSTTGAGAGSAGALATNHTTGIQLDFPNNILNIKANSAYVSVEHLAYEGSGGMAMEFNPCVVLQTSIATSSCFSDGDNMNYFENIVWTDQFQSSLNHHIESMSYNRKLCARKILCSNPLGSAHRLQFYHFNTQGARVLTDFTTNNFNMLKVFLTLKVELVEEEIKL